MSVITNSYNAARYLKPHIQSVLNQEYQEWEHIIIDCGSTDGSPALISSLSHPRLRLIQVPFCGVAKGRKLGIAQAQGELIAILDADDLSFPARLRRQVNLLTASPLVVAVGSGIIGLNDATGRTRTSLYPEHHRNILLLMRAGFNPIPHSTLLFRRPAYCEVNGYSEAFEKAEDFEFLLRLGLLGQLASIPQPLVQCTMRQDSHTHRHRPKGRGVPYYMVLAMILHALDCEATAPRLTVQRVEEWLDSIGDRGIDALMSRWAFGSILRNLRHLDRCSLRYLTALVLRHVAAIRACLSLPWWSEAQTPDRLAWALLSSEKSAQ